MAVFQQVASIMLQVAEGHKVSRTESCSEEGETNTLYDLAYLLLFERHSPGETLSSDQAQLNVKNHIIWVFGRELQCERSRRAS